MIYSSIIRRFDCLISLVLVLLLPACKSIAEAPSPPTLIPLRLAYTPALKPWIPRLVTCADKQPEAAVYLEKIPVDQFNFSQYDAVLQLGKTPLVTGSAYLLGYDELEVIVNKKNPVSSINTTELQSLFDGSQATWDPLSPPNAVYVVSVQPWHYLPESELSDLAVSELYLTQIPGAARLAADPGQVLEGVSSESGAIGFVPVSWLADNPAGIKTIRLTGENEAEKIPVLAITRVEPQVALRNLLACVSTQK